MDPSSSALSPRARWAAALGLMGACLLVLCAILPSGASTLPLNASEAGKGATLAANGAFLQPTNARQLADDQPVASQLYNVVWGLLCLLCCVLQIIAWKMSKGEPAPLGDLQADTTNSDDLIDKEFEIKQLWEPIELCDIEAKQRYKIADKIYMDERSNCFQRIIASTNRELTLFAHRGDNKREPVFMKMFKPYHLQGCCFCRPKFEVYKAEQGAPTGTGGEGFKRIGEIKDPFRCCTMDQQVFKENSEHRYTVAGTICQCGLCCPCCCDVKFDIKNGRTNEVEGEVKKPALSFMECCTKTNRFKVNLPGGAEADDKKLLLACAMLLDLEYFETNKN